MAHPWVEYEAEMAPLLQYSAGLVSHADCSGHPVYTLVQSRSRSMIEARSRFVAYSLTTVEITYHMPDYPNLLQKFIWQAEDVLPHFPVLQRFLSFWSRNLEGRLHS